MENHYLSVENREKLTINQVIDVEAFDEQNLWANIKDGAIEIGFRGRFIDNKRKHKKFLLFEQECKT